MRERGQEGGKRERGEERERGRVGRQVEREEGEERDEKRHSPLHAQWTYGQYLNAPSLR